MKLVLLFEAFLGSVLPTRYAVKATCGNILSVILQKRGLVRNNHSLYSAVLSIDVLFVFTIV